MMDTPKLYRPIVIRFSSLRSGIGANLGVIFDIDTVVERLAMKVRVSEGWKWQIKNMYKIAEYDYVVETDQEVLDMIGMDTEDVTFPNNKWL